MLSRKKPTLTGGGGRLRHRLSPQDMTPTRLDMTQRFTFTSKRKDISDDTKTEPGGMKIGSLLSNRKLEKPSLTGGGGGFRHRLSAKYNAASIHSQKVSHQLTCPVVNNSRGQPVDRPEQKNID